MIISGSKRNFRVVLRLNPNLMVSKPQVNLGKDSINQINDLFEVKDIQFYGDLVQLLVINIQPQGPILLYK